MNATNRSDSQSDAACSGLLCDVALLCWANLAGVTIGAGGFFAVLAVKWISNAAWFKILQQFLIAAAISTLTGDALLHLIMHALLDGDHKHGTNHATPVHNHSHDHEHERDHDHDHDHDHEHEHEHDHEHEHHDDHQSFHDSMVWRGLAGLCGIFLFILLGRIGELVHTIRHRTNKKCNPRKHTHHVPSCTDSTNDETATEASASPTSIDEQGDLVPDEKSDSQRQLVDYKYSNVSVAPLLSTQVSVSVTNGTNVQEVSGAQLIIDKEETMAEFQHGHGHGHGHGHEIKGDVNGAKTLIGTVLVGDAMHNFCDGLIIGVGFASGRLGGLSTSIAVFCHELPHELGDFAFLLHCGMTMRNALLCNVVSAVVCMAGLWMGLLLDQAFKSLAPWVYMFTAGMFLHIALATMIPELTLKTDSSGARTGRPCASIGDIVARFAAQITGLLFGAAIMICIAMYEGKLEQALQIGPS